jgi:hypothetical protein
MEPVFEDFKKTGEVFICTACGHRYPSRAATPFLTDAGRPQVFSAADLPEATRIFKSDERRRCCGWCRHFIVNPFNQRCGLSNRAVEATDLCARFEARADASASGAQPSGAEVADRLDALLRTRGPDADQRA